MKFKHIILSALSLSLLAQAGVASADRRAFTHTYEYMTIPKGDLELEFYNTESRAEFKRETVRNFEQQIEIEYGITSRWDISLYQVFKQTTDNADPAGSSPYHYDKWKVRTRYRFSERGQSAVDTLLYFEFQKKFNKDEFTFEPKLILARDFGKVTAALNIIPELELEEEPDGEKELEFEPGWAFGVTYEVSPKLKLGGETFGKWKSPGNNNDVSASVGPSVSWAPSSKLWATVNAGFGVTDKSDDFTVRFIVGLGL